MPSHKPGLVRTLRFRPPSFRTLRVLSRSLVGLGASLAWSSPLPTPFPSAQASAFWGRVYREIPADQGLIHDTLYPDRIYEQLDLHGLSPKRQSAMIQSRRQHWKTFLLRLHHRGPQIRLRGRSPNTGETLTPEERRILELFAFSTEIHPFLAAAHRRRLHFQRGQREAYAAGWLRSGAYLQTNPAHPGTDFPSLFRGMGLPPELARLPAVESSFNKHAVSKTGASGIWQLALDTARLRIRVDPPNAKLTSYCTTQRIDERNDPWRATVAAGFVLQSNYASLGQWDLAVTAYNHGRKSLLRAIRQLGTDDLALIARHYHQRSFGFASAQFWHQLQTILFLEGSNQRPGSSEDRNSPPSWTEFQLEQAQTLTQRWQSLPPGFSATADLPSTPPKEFVASFWRLNPALSCPSAPLPAHYPLRWPSVSLDPI